MVVAMMKKRDRLTTAGWKPPLGAVAVPLQRNKGKHGGVQQRGNYATRQQQVARFSPGISDFVVGLFIVGPHSSLRVGTTRARTAVI